MSQNMANPHQVNMNNANMASPMGGFIGGHGQGGMPSSKQSGGSVGSTANSNPYANQVQGGFHINPQLIAMQ